MYSISFDGYTSMNSGAEDSSQSEREKSENSVEMGDSQLLRRLESREELKDDPEASETVAVTTPLSSPINPEINDATILKSVQAIVLKYCAFPMYSWIPGIHWIADKRWPSYLRIFFVLVLLVGLVWSTCIVFERYNHYLRMPTTISVIPGSTEKYIRFPKVTACLEPTASGAEALQGAKSFHKLDLLLIMKADQLWDRWNTTEALITAELWQDQQNYSVSVSTKATSQGFCSVFTVGQLVPIKSVLRISFKTASYRNQDGLMKESSTIYLSDETTDFSQEAKVYFQNGVTTWVSAYQLRRSKISARTNPCGTQEDFVVCKRECFYDQWEKMELTCRMPYMMHKTLPTCKTPSEAARSMTHYASSVNSVKRNRNCNCIEPCTSVTYSTTEKVESIRKENPYTTILLQIVNELYESEIYSYDILSFIKDCAESFELINGLSALLLLYCVPYAFSQTTFNIKKNILQNSSLNELATVLFYAEMKKPEEETNTKTWKYYFPLAFLIFSIFSCAVTVVALIAYRICAYESNPTYISQYWTQEPNRTLPDLIICGEGRNVGSLRRVIAHRHNLSICDIKIWDMLGLSNVDMKELWQMTDIREFLVEKERVPELTISSPYGQCFKVLTDEFAEEAVVRFDPKTEFTPCQDSGLKVFISMAEKIDTKMWLTPHIELAVPGISEIKLQDITMFEQENCQERNGTCENACWENMLIDNLDCRLPYMPNMSGHIDVCNSSKQAVAAHNLYMELLAQFDPFTPSCGCVRPCAQKVVLFDEQSHHDIMTSVTTLRFRFSSPISVIQSQTNRDNPLKVTKDCFRLVKLFLGLSLVGIVYMILTASSYAVILLFPKKKNTNKTFPVKRFPEPETVLPIT